MHASRTQPLVPPAEDVRKLEHDDIARLAYFYWEARGRRGGEAREDWLRAERELRERDSR